MKHFEGRQLHAYRDEVGVWTIGYGHTGLQHKDGTVHGGRVITQAQADELLLYDMHQFEARVYTLRTYELLAVRQFSALVSFDFNTGGLLRSTLGRLVERRAWKEAAAQFGRWTRAGGKVLPGLVRRRNAEREMFMGGDWRKFEL